MPLIEDRSRPSSMAVAHCSGLGGSPGLQVGVAELASIFAEQWLSEQVTESVPGVPYLC